MLDTLDVLIAFTVIFTVLSLCITIIVQMVSATLALRGKNLANALSLTFQTIDPRLGEHAHDLATRILSDPIFSDSIWKWKTRPTWKTNAFLVAYRAEQDAQRALDAAAAGEKATAAERLEAAQAAVQTAAAGVPKPAVSRPWKPWFLPAIGGQTLASAIRPSEVYRILHEWSALSEMERIVQGVPESVATSASDLLKALGKRDGPAKEARDKLDAVVAIANLFPRQQQAVVNAMAEFGATVDRATTQAYDRFQRWFGSAQDRAEQWFTAHTRIITIVSGALVAILLQLDTVEIFRVLRSRPEVVKQLVEKAAPAVLAEGGKVLDSTNTPASHTYDLWLEQHPLYQLTTLPSPATADAYEAALRSRVEGDAVPKYLLARYETDLERETKAQLKAETFKAQATPDPRTQATPDPAKATANAYATWKKHFPAYALNPAQNPVNMKLEEVKAALQARAMEVNAAALGASDETKRTARAEWVADYKELLPAGTKHYLENERTSYVALTTAVQLAGFDLVPARFWHRWEHWTFEHCLGIIITAGLLSLGAPFWFNLLKNLMNLRPAVAKLVEKRPNSSPALPQEPTA